MPAMNRQCDAALEEASGLLAASVSTAGVSSQPAQAGI